MAPLNLQLKHYQQNALDDLKSYLQDCPRYGAKVAFINKTNLPYKNAPNINEGTPYICLRIPTGGGKTIMGAHAVGIAASEYLQVSNPMVLWLVPSEDIRKQTISALKNINHPYRAALAKDFGDDVSILSKDEALSLSRADAEVKRQIGDFWAEISNGKCLFCMPTDKKFNCIDETINTT